MRPSPKLNLSAVLASGTEEVRPASGRDVEVVPGVIYRPRADELHLTIGTETRLVLSPGKRFAEALARTMTEAAAREERIASFLAEDDDVRPCDRCGEKVHELVLNTGEEIEVDVSPHPSGVYLRLGEGIGRMLHPHEVPTAPVYRKHRCGRRK